MITPLFRFNRSTVNRVPRVLLVDDEVGFTRCTKASLEMDGQFELKTVNRAREAVDAALEFMPDVIILDINLPDGNGGQIASLLMDFPAFRDTPILFLTSLVTRREVSRSKGSIGGRTYLPKPISADELETCIRAALSKPRT